MKIDIRQCKVFNWTKQCYKIYKYPIYGNALTNIAYNGPINKKLTQRSEFPKTVYCSLL